MKEYTAEEIQGLPNVRYVRVHATGRRLCKGCKLLNGSVIHMQDVSLLDSQKHDGCTWTFIPVVPDDPAVLNDSLAMMRYVPDEPVLEFSDIRRCLEQSRWWKKREAANERSIQEECRGKIISVKRGRIP